MAKHKVTEEDIRLTEALIGQSFGRLKTTVARAPHDLIRPATSTIRDHPFMTTAAAVGTGIVAFRIIRMLTPRVVVKEVPAKHNITVQEGGGGGSMVSQILALAAPYVMGVLQQELGKMMAGPQQKSR
ncbi:hypothetical protein [Methanocella arvoryzae]|uniref:hypothetical protein n=1 Tax=Methanocella arvoryzae TaxID=1175445 RepID=UPI00032466EF|nr:hypothetical protein [Methanocella arvoryzae]